MQSIHNNGSPLEGAGSEAIKRGLLGLLAKPGDKSTGGAETFSREVERAVERQGGKQSIEDRRLQQSNSRRSKRHASFGGDGQVEREPRLSERRREEELPEELVPVEQRVQPSENRRAAQSRVPSESGAPQKAGAPATPSGKHAPQSQATGQATSAFESQNGADQNAHVAPGIAHVQPAAAGAPAAANATPLAQPSSSARPVDGSQAFVDAAKAKAGTSVSKPAAPAGSTPDPKLIEHAEKVLRQIRVNLRPGLKQITLNLNPVDLGRLSIDLRMQQAGLTAVVRAESPETLELLKHQAPELRAVLAQQGIETEQMEFKLAFDASGSSQQGTPEQAPGEKRDTQAAQDKNNSTNQPPSSSVPKPRDDGGVDTLA